MEKKLNDDEMLQRIKHACSASVGVMESSFLCQSLGALCTKDPLTLTQDKSVGEAIQLLQKHKVGCVAVVDVPGKIVGIFTERDCVLKVTGRSPDVSERSVMEFMTPNPICQRPDCTIAFALNLMSSGGFRHIPVVDDDDHPIGVVSVKDVVDYIVGKMLDDLVNFEGIVV